MQKSKKLKSYPLTLKSLSPVFIGNDKAHQLFPNTDYFLEGKDPMEAHLIDNDALDEHMMKNPQLLSQYVAEISAMEKSLENQRYELGLGKFYFEELGLDREVFIKRSLPAYGMKLTAQHELNLHVKSNALPIIPGSSIKGAISSAIIYDWLVNKEEGKARVKEVIEELNDRKKRIYFDTNRLFGHPVKAKFGPASRLIRLTDAQLASKKEALALYGSERVNIFESKSTIPLTREAIKPEIQFKSEIAFELAGDKHPKLAFLKKADISSLLSMIHAFSMASIQNEIRMLQTSPLKEDPVVRSFLNFYQQLVQDQDISRPYIRIGGGKTYFDNVPLALAILNYTSDDDSEDNPAEWFKLFREKLNLRKKQDDYPLTRVIAPGGKEGSELFLPFGWFRLSQE